MMDVNDIERLFKAHFSQMQRLAMALLHDEDIARDIVHDVFARLLDYSQGAPVGPGYLMMAVRNHCLNHIRACEIRERVAKLYFHDNDVYASESWPDEETITLIYDLIQSEISQQGRRVIELRFTEGLPFSEIAVAMGISKNAVFRHLRKALSIIRKKINQYE